MNQKPLTILSILTVAIVTVSVLTYLAFTNAIWYGELTTIALIAIIITFALYVLYDRAKNAKKGLPNADERLKLVNYKAGYYGFIAAIWTAVFTPAIADILWDYEPPGHIITAAVVIVAGIVFAVSYLYLARKGT